MKIQNVTQLAQANQLREKPASGKAEQATQASAAHSIQNTSQLHQTGADTGQDIDTLRVEELREAIASGKFEIRADRIAEGLIASLQEDAPPEAL
ncbi:flagellar biosynthesis anti-sigma factor FlgM [Microbulbifer sp. SA54]|uniref:flagellar biosynthesis anti-sigma factor FlgM n=1 Tax=Microbulbifer sp. SA54 TaxID=3401577 RepID=UPI003AAD8FA9